MAEKNPTATEADPAINGIQAATDKAQQQPKTNGTALAWTATTLFMGLSLIVEMPLAAHRHQGQSFGIIRLELADSFKSFDGLMAIWKPDGPAWVGFSLGFDYLLIIAYSAAFFLTCRSIAAKIKSHRLKPVLVDLAILFSFLGPLAGVLDAVENILLMTSLSHWLSLTTSVCLQNGQAVDPVKIMSTIDTLAGSTAKVATTKFVLVIAVLLFISAMHFTLAWSEKQTPRRSPETRV